LRRNLRATRTGARKAATIAAIGGAAVLGAAGIRKLAARGSSHRSIRHSSSIAVSRTPEECYRYWRDFQKLPLFFKNLKEIHGDGDGRLHWVSRGPNGKEIPWSMELTEDIPGHLIAWRSVGDTRITESGSVRFEPIGGGKGTIVRLHVQHELPSPTAARVISTLLGSDPMLRVRKTLMRFKQLLETGEIATTEGQPAGRSRSTTWLDQVASI
jgi:uncharacterized membrane protein